MKITCVTEALLAVALAVLVSAGLGAQVLTGGVVGAIRDESGAVLPGVTVSLSSASIGGEPMVAATDASGAYRFVELRPGIYELKIELSGFAPYNETDLRVAVGGTLERSVVLKVGSLQETITVSGQSPIVDARQTALTANIPTEVIESVPVSRYAIQDYALLTPGAAQSTPGRESAGQGKAILGSQPNETSWLIDGVVTNNPNSGGPWNGGDFDAIEEVQIQSVGPSAEYQVAQGGVFSVVYKSGTNQFRGNVNYIMRPDAWVSSPIDLACNCPLGETGFSSIFLRDWNTHIGGPIVPDRFWFFGGLQNRGVTTGLPGVDIDNIKASGYDDEGLITFRRYTGKFTGHLWGDWRTSITLTNDIWREGSIGDAATPFSATTQFGGDIPTTAWELTTLLTNRTLFTFRATTRDQPEDFSSPRSGDFVTPRHDDQLTGVASGGVPSFSSNYNNRRSVSGKLTHNMRIGGIEHDLRGGVQWEGARAENRTAVPSGVRYLDYGGAPDLAIFTPPSVNGAKYEAPGFWIEDQLTFGRVSFQAGIRFDHMSATSPDVNEVDDLLNETGTTVTGLGHMFTWNTWSPRAGITLKVTDDGRTILRSNGGRYYKPIFLNDFSNVHPGISVSTTMQWVPATGGYTKFIESVDPLANIAVDPNIKAGYTDQFSIGLDRQVATNWRAAGTYVWKDSRNFAGWTDIGGRYAQRVVRLPDGQTVTVFDLLNSPSARKFLRTNGVSLVDGQPFFTTYNGVVLSVNRRRANRYSVDASYTFSAFDGLQTNGQDPNAFVNAEGRQATYHRPHQFQVAAAYIIPKIEVELDPLFLWFSGQTFAPQASVVLPQGRQNINVAPPNGDFVVPNPHLLGLRVTKHIELSRARLEIGMEIANLLQDESYQSLITRNFYSPNFALPSIWVDPRMALFKFRASF